MPSSKKQRAKQRKEATRLASNNAIQTTADKLMDGIRRGSSSITQSAACKVARQKNPGMLDQLINNGLLDVLLGFLVQCGQVDIKDVRTNIDGRKVKVGDDTTYAYGRIIKDAVANPIDAISCPLAWFSLIISSVIDGNLPTAERTVLCRLKVAKSIGPVVRCMCVNEEIFQSKEHWYASICSFVSLVRPIVRTKESIELLVEYGGFMEFVVQSMFFDVYRPNVLANAKIEHFNRDVLYPSEQIVRSIVFFYIQEEKECRIRAIAAITPIDGSDVSFVASLINTLEPVFYPLVDLLIKTRNVDKGVIAGVIMSAKNSPDYKSAIVYANYIFDVIAPVSEDWDSNMNMPNGNHYTFALYLGLVSVCLELLVQHEREDQYNGYELLTQLGLILDSTCGVSLSRKSFKALLRQRDHIMEAIKCAEFNLDKSNQRSQGILRTIKKAVLLRCDIEKYISNEDCNYCDRSLSKAEVKLCGRCLQVAYCSRKCQEKHWLIHHHCKQVASNEINVPDSKAKKREKAQARNAYAVSEKFVTENWLNILAEATLLGYDIVKCAVIIDLVLRPSVAVKLIADLAEGEKSSLEDLDLSEGSLASVCHSLPHNACGPTLKHSRVHKLNCSWQDAQIRYKNGDFTEEYHGDENAKVMRELFFADLATVKPH